MNQPAPGLKRKLNESTAMRSPADLVPEIFRSNGYDIIANPSMVKVSFLHPSPEMIAAYKVDTLRAARSEDIEELRKLHNKGSLLQCCNAFGESLIHIACRRGSIEMVKFLVEEANVSLLVKDDYGRTPLHDACWTSVPRLDLVLFVLQKAPELLCVKDVRGHTPLNYARKDHWETWHKFLKQHKALLKPKSALLSLNHPSPQVSEPAVSIRTIKRPRTEETPSPSIATQIVG